MAVALQETIITKNFDAKNVQYAAPTSTTNTDTFTFALNNSSDDILLVIDTLKAAPGVFTIRFDKGDYPSSKTPDPFEVYDGLLCVISIESGMIEKKDSTAAFTVTFSNSNISNSGLKLGLIKKRFVTNN